MNELKLFLDIWALEAKRTVMFLQALPATQYDFRPDPGGRSLGELAWHLAESDGFMSYGIEAGQFHINIKPPHIERPRTIEGLAPGYELVHREAEARIRTLALEDLDRSIPFFTGQRFIRNLLWEAILAHGIHHRGQLAILCRLAGGQTPSLYGPNREETAALRTMRVVFPSHSFPGY